MPRVSPMYPWGPEKNSKKYYKIFEMPNALGALCPRASRKKIQNSFKIFEDLKCPGVPYVIAV